MDPSELKRIEERTPSGWKISFRGEVPVLEKIFCFRSYKSAVEFVNALAGIAEEMDHHPDLTLRYDSVTVEITTHSKRTITDLDLSFVEKVERGYPTFL